MSCQKLVCVSDECSQDTDSGNLCRSLGGGKYSCTCAFGWRLRETELGHRCDPPLDPCEYDPCRAKDNQGNTCSFDRALDRYTCECNARGWTKDLGLDQRDVCMPIASACRGDPCSSGVDRANICVDNRDGTHFCRCEGNRFGPTDDNQVRLSTFRLLTSQSRHTTPSGRVLFICITFTRSAHTHSGGGGVEIHLHTNPHSFI